MVYVTVAREFRLLTSVWAIVFPLPSEKPVAVPEVSAAVQVKVVPAVGPVRLIAVVPLEQMVCAAGVAVAVGTGLMVITTTCAGPVHPLAAGVMVYVTVAGSVPEFVSVWAIRFPLPLLKPAADPVVRAAVQLKVAPAVVLVRAIPVVEPEQKACEAGVAIAIGAGLTVTVTVTGVPAQPLAVGVMV
jgi:hypothetical protein